ncbi:MAG TPA: hypothetical protein VNY24_00280 [Candidatus Acidoferrales bacterium]|nr:hypothetical protein [Candidatus Acidoferrales bacterium]
MAASLLVLLSGELLKWQFPALATGEKLASLATALRKVIPVPACELIRR